MDKPICKLIWIEADDIFQEIDTSNQIPLNHHTLCMLIKDADECFVIGAH